jgi:hypothetical protein
VSQCEPWHAIKSLTEGSQLQMMTLQEIRSLRWKNEIAEKGNINALSEHRLAHSNRGELRDVSFYENLALLNELLITRFACCRRTATQNSRLDMQHGHGLQAKRCLVSASSQYWAMDICRS